MKNIVARRSVRIVSTIAITRIASSFWAHLRKEQTMKSDELQLEAIQGDLFDHIAHCIALFTEEQFGKKKRKLPLGFTFSFATRIEGLTK
ncbi:hypothetical protein Y032_0414g1030 [Ancylostoma ceylanicum]|uniref:Phosphotransferase n=1 Tax=Ancylostoma ceylanicum TaxID=53326 RepID=A0A016X1T9_9BILA|nr:hypothetical protein Y032_0414g1030 [Ancylostoma ceylanicum]